MSNPFKYGSIVEGDYFTDRADDMLKAVQIIESAKNASIPTNTRYSAYKRLLKKGFLIQNKEGYRMEDPFFAMWIFEKRENRL